MYLRANNSKHGESGTPYYVGKGKKMRAYSTSHRVRPPMDKSRIVFAVRDISESSANIEEKRLIAFYGRIDKGAGCLRNLTDGGEGQCGAIWTSEVIEKRAAAMRGRKQRPEVVARMRAARLAKGIPCREPRSKSVGPKILSQSHRERISVALLGRKKSKEHAQSISRAKLGGKRSPEICEKQRIIMTGTKLSDTTREKMRISAIAARARKKAESLA